VTKEQARHEIRELSFKLKQYQEKYYVDSRPIVSDREYDLLFDRLFALEKEFPDLIEPDSPTHRVGSDLTQEFPEAEHTIPVLSLDKAYNLSEVKEWIEKCNLASSSPLSFVCEEKIDGASIVLYYKSGILYRALTRGNGIVGNDITSNVRTIPTVPLNLKQAIDIVVRGEIFLPKALFQEINASMEIPYANPRNLASGTLRRIKSAEVAKIPLDIFVYEGHFTEVKTSHTTIIEQLMELGFKVNNKFGVFGDSIPHLELKTRHPDWTLGKIEELPEFLSRETTERNYRPYEIDGLVIKVDDLAVREELGYTGHHPRWAIAFKFEAPQGVTRVKSIDVQVGRTGRITPVARIEPVKVSGSTISNVTLHNQEYIDILELAIEDTVAVSKRGDVIPALEKVIEKNESGFTTWKMPASCPSCGQLLEKKGAHHFCFNPLCRDRQVGQIKFFTGRGQMDIENLGYETIDFLFDRGLVKNIEDIYTFDPNELLEYPGFAKKKVELLRQGIEKSKSQPFHIVLQALGIPEVGKKAVELLLEAGFTSIDSLIKTAKVGDPAPFLAIHGIGDKVAETLLKEFSNDKLIRQIESLRRLGLQFTEQRQTPAQDRERTFQGQKWCITGSFAYFKPRDKALEEIKKRGGAVIDNVSAKTTHLLVGSTPGSKYQKALSLGITILNEEEFLRLLRK
jgi:DNA ligase (NAD+)